MRGCPTILHKIVRVDAWVSQDRGAGELLGRQTQGVALGYPIQPFQGCLNSRLSRMDAWVSLARTRASRAAACAGREPVFAAAFGHNPLVTGEVRGIFSGTCPPYKVANGQNSRLNLA